MTHRRTGVRLLAAGLLVAGAALAGAACDVNVSGGGFNVGLASGKATDTWTRTYTVSDGGTVEIANTNGSITVEPSSASGRVEVRAERLARSSTDEAAAELLKKVEIHEDASASRVRIETRAPKTWGRDGHEVKYFLKVPTGLHVEVRTKNGGIEVTGIPNDVIAGTVNGGIKARDLSGALEGSTTNGGVEVGMTALSQKGVRLETTNGGIALTLPRDANADLTAQVVNGGISVDDALGLARTGESTRRRVEGRLHAGGTRVELSTTNGGIHVDAR